MYDHNEKEEPFFEEQTLFDPIERNGAQCYYRIPTLLVSRNGTLFSFPEERMGNVGDASRQSLVLRRSFDNGQTWTPLEILRENKNPRVKNSINAAVADQETGQVFVFYGTGVVLESADIGGAWPEQWATEHPEEAKALREKLAPGVQSGRYLIWTDDEGESWSEPTQIGKELHVHNPVTDELRPFGPQFTGIQLQYGPHKGRLILPGRGFTQGAPFALFAYAHNYVIYSDDHGATWQAGGLAQTGTGEGCLVELSDGTVYLNSRNESLRCRGYRAWDRSRDGGATFTESGYDLNLPEPHCEASMVRYSGAPDGTSRILFCNPATFTDSGYHAEHDSRRNLTVRLSEDECQTWCASRTLYPDRCGYSALAVTPDGMIHCAYEILTVKNYTGRIQLARFNLAWLREQA